MKATVMTRPLTDGRIEQTLTIDGQLLAIEVMATQDDHTRNALIQLGWQPPGQAEHVWLPLRPSPAILEALGAKDTPVTRRRAMERFMDLVKAIGRGEDGNDPANGQSGLPVPRVRPSRSRNRK